MRYSIEPTERRYIKGYGFLSFAKNIGKNLSNKYGQKLADGARAIQKRAEITGDLVGTKIADKIISDCMFLSCHVRVSECSFTN